MWNLIKYSIFNSVIISAINDPSAISVDLTRLRRDAVSNWMCPYRPNVRECWNGHESAGTKLNCCQFDEGFTDLDFRNPAHQQYDRVKQRLEKFSAPANVTFAMLQMLLETNNTIHNKLSIVITDRGISIVNDTSWHRSHKAVVNISMNQDRNVSREKLVLQVGFITLGNIGKILEETPNNFTYMLFNLGLLSVVIQPSEKFDREQEVSFTYDLTSDYTLESFAKNRTVSDIKASCAELTKDEGWRKNDDAESDTDLTRITCKCTAKRCFLQGVTQELQLFTSDFTHDFFFVFTPISLTFTCLLLALSAGLLFGYRKYLKSRRTVIQISITVSFFMESATAITSLMLHVTFEKLFGLSPFVCQSTAILILYFRLTSSAWLLADGIILFITIKRAGYISYKTLLSARNATIISLINWGIPGIITGAIGAYDLSKDTLLRPSALFRVIRHRDDTESLTHLNQSHQEYISFIKHQACFPEHDSIMEVVATTVIFFAFLANLIISIYVASIVWKKSRTSRPFDVRNPSTQDTSRSLVAGRALLTLSLSLGLPQFFTLLFRENTSDFLTEVMIANALLIVQGPIVFYFYCLKNTDLMNAVRNSLRRSE